MQRAGFGRSALLVEFPPLPPGLAEIQPCSEAKFADDTVATGLPALVQTVGLNEDIGAFGAPVRAAIKVIAKFG